MKGGKDEFIQQSEKINSVLKETDELSPILFKSIDAAKMGKYDNFLGYWTFPAWRIGYWIFNYVHILCVYPLKMKTNHGNCISHQNVHRPDICRT